MKSVKVSRIWVKSAESLVFVKQDCESVQSGDLVLDASSEVATLKTYSESHESDQSVENSSMLGVATLAGRPYPFD